MKISSHPNDFIIGKVKYLFSEDICNMEISHVGNDNKVSYNDFENIKITNKVIPNSLIGKTIKCTIQYRNVNNVLLCTIEKYNVQTKTKT